MAAVRRLEFWKFKFLPVPVKKSILYHRTKLRKARSNRYGDIVIFKMAAAAILDFRKFVILTVDPL